MPAIIRGDWGWQKFTVTVLLSAAGHFGMALRIACTSTLHATTAKIDDHHGVIGLACLNRPVIIGIVRRAPRRWYPKGEFA
jgi:hypothetical protein